MGVRKLGESCKSDFSAAVVNLKGSLFLGQ